MEPIATFNEDFPSFAKVDSNAGGEKAGDMAVRASRHFTNSHKLKGDGPDALSSKLASTTPVTGASQNNSE